MLLLTAICSWAQKSKASDEKPIAPVIVEGTLEGVPDGTVIMVQERKGGTKSFFREIEEGIDTLRNGIFRIVYTPMNQVDEYMLTVEKSPRYLLIYVSPGSKCTIKGVGVHPANWYAKSDNPKQIEANEYRAYLDEKLPRYRDLQEKRDRSTVEAESLYVEYMIEFMKDRKYSSVFASNLCTLSLMILEGKNKNKGIKEKAVKLLAIVPKDEEQRDQNIYDAKKRLLPKYSPIKIGEKLHDFVLYDHQGKVHHLTEFNGNGKFLLLEFNSRTCVPCVEHRPNAVLNNLYKNHSDKVDMLMVNCDPPYYWDIECKDPNKYGRDPWHEWNDKKGAEDIKQRYGTETGPSYFFVSPDGTILGRISYQEDLKAAIAKYFKI